MIEIKRGFKGDLVANEKAEGYSGDFSYMNDFYGNKKL